MLIQNYIVNHELHVRCQAQKYYKFTCKMSGVTPTSDRHRTTLCKMVHNADQWGTTQGEICDRLTSVTGMQVKMGVKYRLIA